MKNITVSIDDETYRRARIRAAELNTSVSSMVKKYLTSVSNDAQKPVSQEEFHRLKQLEEEIRSRITNFNGGDRLSRDELYDRKRS
jgi:plasmid stability protein